MPSNLFLLETQHLTFSREHRIIFNDFNMVVPRHRITAIMGPSGAGKTTLLKLLTRQIKPNHGDVLLDGKSIVHLNRREIYKVRRKMGVLFQQGALFTDLNVFENVAFALREHTDLSEAMIKDLVLMKLEAVGLRGVAHFDVSSLSGGMARRVALARAIMLDPKIMFYDEPFTGQDPISQGVLLKLIKELNDSLQLTTIIVSHDIQKTFTIADHVIILSDTRELGSGSPKTLLESQDPTLNQFLHGRPDGAIPFNYPAQDFVKELGLDDHL